MYSSTKLQVINYNTSLLPPPTTSGTNSNCNCNCDVRWNKTFQTIHWAVLHVQCCVRQEDKEVFPHNCQYCVLTSPPSHTLTFRIHPDCIQMILFTFTIILLTIYSILHHYNTVSIHLSLYTIVGITKTNTNNLPQGQGSVNVGLIHFMDLISLWNCQLTTKLFFIRRTSELVISQEKLISKKEKVRDKLILTLTRTELLNFLFWHFIISRLVFSIDTKTYWSERRGRLWFEIDNWYKKALESEKHPDLTV